MNVLLHTPTRTAALQAEDPLYVRSLLPQASRLIDMDGYNVQVRHTLESTRILKNIGFPIQSPIVNQYNWPGIFKPLKHQIDTASELTLNHRMFNLSEPGAAKTASALWAADYLMSIGRVRKCVILAKLSTLDDVWCSDIFKLIMHRKAVEVHGDRQHRLDMLAADVDFYVLNHEGLCIKAVHDHLMARQDIDLVIIDEIADFRNDENDAYRLLVGTSKVKPFLRPHMRVWGLTGTPTPNYPTDAWAQARIISPHLVPMTFGTFKRMTMTQVTPFKWEAKPGAEALVHKILQPAVRYLKRDVLPDLPEMLPPVNIKVELTPIQIEKFQEMKEEMKAEFGTAQITAVNAADKLGKLRQVLAGAIKDPETETYLTIDHTPRLKALLTCIRSAKGKVLVIVPFKGIINELSRELAANCATKFLVLNGDVTIPRRKKIVKAFKTDPAVGGLLCHPKVMSHGLNLTEADTLIFYGPIYSNDQYAQVIERFHRMGQTRVMHTYRLWAHAIELAIYRKVDQRGMSQTSLLNLFKQEVMDMPLDMAA